MGGSQNTSGERPHGKRPLHHLLLEAASLVAFLALQVLGWMKFEPQALVPDSVLLSHCAFLFLAFVAWVLADMVSGLAHFAADNYGSERTPLIGRTIIIPFREHHADPQAMLAHGFLERNGNSALISLSVLFWMPFSGATTSVRAFAAVCLMMTLWVLVTNQIHAWAHSPSVPTIVGFLQRAGIILSPDHHAVHHAPYEALRAARGIDGSALEACAPDSPTEQVVRPRSVHSSSGNYCITSGFCDRALGWFRPRRQGLARSTEA